MKIKWFTYSTSRTRINSPVPNKEQGHRKEGLDQVKNDIQKTQN